jgi:hypothetical protein
MCPVANADHEYVHENKAVRGFGSYGDILIRDRKMYVAPTPYGLVDGAAHHQTLIVPSRVVVPDGFKEVGEIIRTEVDELVVRYTFDLRNNDLKTEKVPNPHAGRKHIFCALRLIDGPSTPVVLRKDVAADDSIEEDSD